MCLGVPGQIIEVVDADKFLATVAMSDATRTINIALVDADGIAPGDWVLVHAGFALNKMTAEEALEARRILKEMSDAYADELSAAMGGMLDEAPVPLAVGAWVDEMSPVPGSWVDEALPPVAPGVRAVGR